MARDFHERYGEAREVFAEASDSVSIDLAALCFEEDERLLLTEFQQPAILAAEIAMISCLRAHFGFAPAFYGGHSLGEYAALVAAGAMPLANAARLVRERGRLMQEAVPAGQGAMVAIISKDLDLSVLEALLEGMAVDVANDNATDQAVLSGDSSAIKEAAARVRSSQELGRARVLPLRVSASFHSRMMKPIVAPFRATVEEAAVAWAPAAATTVTCNFTGTFHDGTAEGLVEALTCQITGRVRWRENMERLREAAPSIVEVGPGRPLRGFFASLDVEINSVSTLEAAEELFLTH